MAKIMVVDDAAFMRMMLRTMLIEGGHEVVAEAANGLEAVQIYMKSNQSWSRWILQCPRWTG